MAKPENLKIKPYARLLTMLGEQLIKNERIALIELLKNCYDADAPWVKVTFEDFGERYNIKKGSKIIIEDSGQGMNESTIRDHWLHPATPEKLHRKKKKATTPSGRIIQGEKGIGRFAMLKLGRKIDVITRAKGSAVEHVISYDFSRYDDQFLTENGKAKPLFIEDLAVAYSKRRPTIITERTITFGARRRKRVPYGTRIEISDLKGSWSRKKVEAVYGDISRLESIFAQGVGAKRVKAKKKDFEVLIYKDDEIQNFHEDYLEKLRILLNSRPVIKIESGRFDADHGRYNFKLNGIAKSLSLRDPEITGLKVFRDRFDDAGSVLDERDVDCGSFGFAFYVFDFSSDAPKKYELDKVDKQILREHRIYLYRDGIRVYPYGEPDDDWLRIDQYRGTVSAAHFLSNDQVVGYVEISQAENPMLRDKTNREGLIEVGDASEDFIALIQSLLAYIRQKPYARYRHGLRGKKSHDIHRTHLVEKNIATLKKTISDNKKATSLLSDLEKAYKAERQYLTQRAETTEELAGVGLSVETASHDILGIMKKVYANIDGLLRDLMSQDEVDLDVITSELQSIRGGLSFIESQLKDIQLLFTSSKQRKKSLRVKESVEKVERIYRRLLSKEKIDLEISTKGSPLIAKTTDAVLLQLLLNLFDNAVFWLSQTSKRSKSIKILLDGSEGRMVFADNGPGVNDDDAPYIFEPFYSGKGQEGRGLGLYIARQLLERSGYSLELAELRSEKILPGANFVVSFIEEE